MAQQMEYHGVPMKVHFPQWVCDLIKDDGFDIDEKGDTEVKRGIIRTYVATSYAKPDTK
jgi:hypothetical protein